MNDTPTRIRVKFTKVDDLRFTGHIDLQRLFERALRRSGLPIRYSQGFSPKVRLNLASALPLGFSSRAEVLDFWMNKAVDLPIIESALKTAVPSELEIMNVQEVPNKMPSLQGSLKASEFLIKFPKNFELITLKTRLDHLLQNDVLETENRGKTKNLRPMILKIEWIDEEMALRVLMTATPGNTGRPDELVRFLELDPSDCEFERTSLIFEDDHGE